MQHGDMQHGFVFFFSFYPNFQQKTAVLKAIHVLNPHWVTWSHVAI